MIIVTTLHLDPLGRLSTLILANGSTYSRTYDDFGRITHAHDANTGDAHIHHNHDDMPTYITHAFGHTQLNYTSLGQPTIIEQCDQTNNCQHTSLSYDDKARLSHINHPNQEQTLSYDAKGQLSSDSITLSSPTTNNQATNNQANTYTTEYTYDPQGRITHTHLPEGIILTHHYDKHSQLSHLGYHKAQTSAWQTLKGFMGITPSSQHLLSNIKISPIKGLIRLNHANNTHQALSYDDQDRLITKTDGQISTTLGYNTQGVLSSITTAQDNNQDKDSIQSIQNIDTLTQQYHYDPNNNRTTNTKDKQYYTYKPNSDRLSQIVTKDDKGNTTQVTHYTYDRLGNPIMISTTDNKGNLINTRTLDYHPDGQIKSIKDKQANQAEKLIATYQYNHLRQRVSKTTYDNQGKPKDTTHYLWDKGLLSAEIKNNQIQRRYLYLEHTPVNVLDYAYDSKGTLSNIKVYSVHSDHLGTPKAISNDKQETVWQAELDTFGEVKNIQAKDNFTFNLRFAGQYHDTESGYYYNYHRYYDPTLGRYLTSDPIGLMGGSFNTYTYVDGEPWGAYDPYGLMRIYMYPLTNDKASYYFEFDTFFKRVGSTVMGAMGDLGSRAAKIGNIFGTAGEVATIITDPKPYTSKKAGEKECINFEKILIQEFEKMFPNKEISINSYNHRLTRQEAEKFLNHMKKHTNDEYRKLMAIYYEETTKEILKIADDYGIQHHKKFARATGGIGGSIEKKEKEAGVY